MSMVLRRQLAPEWASVRLLMTAALKVSYVPEGQAFDVG